MIGFFISNQFVQKSDFHLFPILKVGCLLFVYSVNSSFTNADSLCSLFELSVRNETRDVRAINATCSKESKSAEHINQEQRSIDESKCNIKP